MPTLMAQRGPYRRWLGRCRRPGAGGPSSRRPYGPGRGHLVGAGSQAGADDGGLVEALQVGAVDGLGADDFGAAVFARAQFAGEHPVVVVPEGPQ